MLIIANGAFKSGSTWQRDILSHIMKYEKNPRKYTSRKNKHLLKEKHISEFVQELDIQNYNYLTKAHIYNKKLIKRIIDNQDVYIFLILREPADAIVSHYHHIKNLKKLNIAFNTYYWTTGRYKLMQLYYYRRNWEQFRNYSNVFFSSFENLKSDFDSEVTNYLNFLGISARDDLIAFTKSKTDIAEKRKSSDREWFYRKGVIGDSRNYFNNKINADAKKISAGKINIVDRVVFYLLIELRQNLKTNIFSGIIPARLLDKI